MKREDDAQLIHEILSGDEAAFSRLVQKYQKSVHALAWRKIGDFHYAEEITQDTFLQVYKNSRRSKIPVNLLGGSMLWSIGTALLGCANGNQQFNRWRRSL